jgi:hypothetical protein
MLAVRDSNKILLNGYISVVFVVSTAVRFMMMMLWFWRRVYSSVDAKFSAKRIVFIFLAEVTLLGNGGMYIGLERGKAEGVGQSYYIDRMTGRMMNWEGYEW